MHRESARKMKIICLDSSGLTASVAILEDDQLVAEYNVTYKKTHSQTLLPMLDELKKMIDLDLATVDAIAIAKGPGSFTGLRIGSATAKGLSQALDKPIVEIGTLEGMACNLYGSSDIICPIMDARRQQVYTGVFMYESALCDNAFAEGSAELCGDAVAEGSAKLCGDAVASDSAESCINTVESGSAKSCINTVESGSAKYSEYRLKTLLPDSAMSIEELITKVSEIADEQNRNIVFLGDGVPVFKEAILEALKDRCSFAPAHMNRQRAAAFGYLALERFAAGEVVSCYEHAPEYLRLSQAERERNEGIRNKGSNY